MKQKIVSHTRLSRICWRVLTVVGFAGIMLPYRLFAQQEPQLLVIWKAKRLCPNMAAPGEILSVSARGLGPTDPPVPIGVIPAKPVSTVLKPEISVGGQVAEVLSSELTNWAAGVYQVNFRVPPDVPYGNQPVVLRIGGFSSNTVFQPVGRTFNNTNFLSGARFADWESGDLGDWLADSQAAPESMVSAFQQCSGGLANTRLTGDAHNPAVILGGTTVRVKDAAGVERMAPLTLVSPTQVNYIIPAGTGTGDATVTITSGDGITSTAILRIKKVAPGLFIRGQDDGVQSFDLVRVRNGVRTVERIPIELSYGRQDGEIASLPVDMGPETDEVFLSLAGTGFRFHGSPIYLFGSATPVEYAGPQGEYAGVDQLNVHVPREVARHKGGYVWLWLQVDDEYENSQIILRIR